jgi:diacylglycerol kinase (ATP)
MRSITILNGHAGQGQNAQPVEEAARRFHSVLKLTEQLGDAAAIARQAVEEGIQRLVIAGGDGTIHEVIQGLAPDFPSIELAVIPLGTGNDLARSLGLPLQSVPQSAELAFTGPCAAVDVVEVRNEEIFYFVNAASGGFGGAVTFEVSPQSKHLWGAFSYWLTALGNLGQLTEYVIDIESDASTSQEPVLGIGINNGRFVGGGFPLAADAKLDDGKMAVTIVPVLSPLELMGVAVDLSMGRREESQQIQAFSTSTLRLTSTPSIPFSLDGETERSSIHWFSVLPGKLLFAYGEQPALSRVP